MKLSDGSEAVLILTDHSYRTAAEDGFPEIDVVEVGTIYHRPQIEPCVLPDDACEYQRHLRDSPACYPASYGTLVLRSIAALVADPCPQPECFPPEAQFGVGLHNKGFRDEMEQAAHG